MTRVSSILLCSSLLLVGCFYRNISHPYWFQHLDGTWEAKTKQGRFIECWKTLNDSTLSGYGLVLSASNDTSFTEELTITKSSSNSWVYRVFLPKAREFRTIIFSSSDFGQKNIIFSHPSNDFPSSIRYRFTSKSRMRVTLYPKEGTEGKKEHLAFKRTAH